jgi:hypothetical protein
MIDLRKALPFLTVIMVATTTNAADPRTSQVSHSEQEHQKMDQSAKEECEQVMNFLIPFAQQMLEKHGEFFPLGAAMQADGKIAALPTDVGDEHPPSQRIIDSLTQVFRRGAKEGKYRATGLAYGIRTVPPGSKEETDAVGVRLDHVRGYSVVVVFPYRISPNHVVTFAASFANKGSGDIFQ